MALAAIQALYDDELDEDVTPKKSSTWQEEVDDRMAVINDPSFSVMSKIKLNLTPAILAQVSQLMCKSRETENISSFLATWHQQFSGSENQRGVVQSQIRRYVRTSGEYHVLLLVDQHSAMISILVWSDQSQSHSATTQP